ncbi:MAG: amino acid permease [Chlorobiaceae bacterium]
MLIQKKRENRTLGYFSATMIIIAAMMGTGIFTLTGYVVKYLPDPSLMISSWIIVGFISLCGALSYAEIASVFHENGGEYLFLSKLIHPSVGFMSGWVSFIVGFSAPCAAAAAAFGAYTATITGFNSKMSSALLIVLFFSIIHIIGLRTGGYIQNALTLLKIFLVILFLMLGSDLVVNNNIIIFDLPKNFDHIYNPDFWTSLLLISYAYAGWNTVVYISGEIKKPSKNIPLALISGTLVVSVLYVAINYIYVQALSFKEMEGVLEIGFTTMRKLYGNSIGHYFSAGIALALASMISALTMAGPRLYIKIATDFHIFNRISEKSPQNMPIKAIILQCIITSLLIVTMNYERLLYYIGFTLNIFSMLTVACVFIIRKKKIYTTFQVPFYPVTPLLFISFNLIVLFQTIHQRPIESAIGFVTMLIGYIIFYFAAQYNKNLLNTSNFF